MARLRVRVEVEVCINWYSYYLLLILSKHKFIGPITEFESMCSAVISVTELMKLADTKLT